MLYKSMRGRKLIDKKIKEEKTSYVRGFLNSKIFINIKHFIKHKYLIFEEWAKYVVLISM